MTGTVRKVEVRFGAFACSIQGYDDPVAQLREVLAMMQRMINETPTLADSTPLDEAEVAGIEEALEHGAGGEATSGVIVIHAGRRDEHVADHAAVAPQHAPPPAFGPQEETAGPGDAASAGLIAAPVAGPADAPGATPGDSPEPVPERPLDDETGREPTPAALFAAPAAAAAEAAFSADIAALDGPTGPGEATAEDRRHAAMLGTGEAPAPGAEGASATEPDGRLEDEPDLQHPEDALAREQDALAGDLRQTEESTLDAPAGAAAEADIPALDRPTEPGEAAAEDRRHAAMLGTGEAPAPGPEGASATEPDWSTEDEPDLAHPEDTLAREQDALAGDPRQTEESTPDAPAESVGAQRQPSPEWQATIAATEPEAPDSRPAAQPDEAAPGGARPGTSDGARPGDAAVNIFAPPPDEAAVERPGVSDAAISAASATPQGAEEHTPGMPPGAEERAAADRTKPAHDATTDVAERRADGPDPARPAPGGIEGPATPQTNIFAAPAMGRAGEDAPGGAPVPGAEKEWSAGSAETGAPLPPPAGPEEHRAQSAAEEPRAMPGDSGHAAPDSAADLAERAGARAVHDLLAASAAWLTLVEGRADVTRPAVMQVFERLPGEHERTLAARIKGFGQLVRSGALVQVGDGIYRLSEGERARFRALIGQE